jgi:hypothetical protein
LKQLGKLKSSRALQIENRGEAAMNKHKLFEPEPERLP